MKGGVANYIVGAGVLLVLAGCGRSMFMGERAPWRHQAEVECMKSGTVKLGAGVVRMEPIEGPGMCGADFPLKVAVLGEGAAAIGYGDDLRPPGSIPNASQMPNWPINEPRYTPPASIDRVDVQPMPSQAGQPQDALGAGSTTSPTRRADGLGRATGRAPIHPALRPVLRQVRRRYPTTSPTMRFCPIGIIRRSVPSPRRSISRRSAPLRFISHRSATRRRSARRERRKWRRFARNLDAGSYARVSAGFGARSLDERRRAAGRHALVRLASHRDQADLVLFLPRHGRLGGLGISEHAFGNALDIAAFTLADGRRITVQEGWHGTPEEQGFLRDVHLAACDNFSTVLAPGYNAAHYNHIHVDLMRRASGDRPCRPEAMTGEMAAAKARALYAKHRGPAYTGSVPVKASRARAAVPGEDGYILDLDDVTSSILPEEARAQYSPPTAFGQSDSR